MTATYSISVKNHLIALSFHLLGSVLMLATLYYFEFDTILTKVFAGFWIIYTVPTLALHLTYIAEDKSKKVVVEARKQLTIWQNNKVIIDKSLAEITSIVVSCSRNMKEFGFPQLPVESYYYLTFHFQDGSKAICTCLIFSNFKRIRKVFIGIPIMFKYGLFNDIKHKKALPA